MAPNLKQQQNKMEASDRELYSNNMVKNNLGKTVRVFLNFLGNSPPDQRIFEGPLKYVGVDFLIVGSQKVGGPTLIYWTNVAYVVFLDTFDIPETEQLERTQIDTYAIDIYKLNKDRDVTVWLNFIGNSPPEQRLFKGPLLIVGADSFVVGSIQIGGPTLAYYVNLAYVVFNEELILPGSEGTQNPAQMVPSIPPKRIEKPSKPPSKLSIGECGYPPFHPLYPTAPIFVPPPWGY